MSLCEQVILFSPSIQVQALLPWPDGGCAEPSVCGRFPFHQVPDFGYNYELNEAVEVAVKIVKDINLSN